MSDVVGGYDDTPADDDAFNSAVRRAVHPLVIGLAILIAVVTFAGGTALLGLVMQARDTQRQARQLAALVDDIQESREQATIGGCRKDNAIRRSAGLAGRRAAEDFVKLQYEALGTSFEQQTPRIQELTLRYFDEQEQVKLDSYPHRDCSSFAKADEFNRHQPLDTEPCVPKFPGLCAPPTTTTTTTTTTVPPR